MTHTPMPDDRRRQAVEAAIELFWRKGYDGVSISDVVEATGLNRYALYQAFGGKKDLFMACLDSYVAGSREAIGALLDRPGSDPVDAMHDAIAEKMLDPAMFPAGCLICTTAADVAAEDQDVADRMAEAHKEISLLFTSAYTKAQKEGRADPNRSPEAFAEMACALYFSTGVQARMRRSREELLSALSCMCDSLRYRPGS